jgi:hypothetical protein
VRLAVLPGPPEREVADQQHWRLTAAHDAEDNIVQITGEMIRVHESWFLTVAAAALIQFEPGSAPPTTTDDEMDDVLLRYGPWAAHPLWDYCRITLLQAASGFLIRPALEIPVLTPEPECITRKMLRDSATRRKRKKSPDEAG